MVGSGPVFIDTEIGIAAPPEAVWPYLVDWENLSQWMKEGSGFRVTSGHREGKGVTATAKIKIAGIVTEDAVVVTEWDPPRLLEIEHLGWVKGSGRISCEVANSGTRVIWNEALFPPFGLIGALGMRVFKPLMRRVFARDLRLLKALAEQRPAGG